MFVFLSNLTIDKEAVKLLNKITNCLVVFILFLPTLTLHADPVEELKDKIEQAKNNQTELNKILKNVKKDINRLENEIFSLKKEIINIENDVSDLEKEITKTNHKIELKEIEIEKKEIELKEKKEKLSNNLNVYYQRGHVSLLEAIFRIDELSNFIFRELAMKNIVKTNKKLHDEIKEQKKQLQIEMKQLDELIQTLHIQKKQLDNKKETLLQKKKINDRLLKELQYKHATIEDKISHEKHSIEEMNGELKAIIKKREEERKKQQNSDNLKGTGNFTMPVKIGYVSSGYGYRIHPVYGTKRLHNGIDIAAAYNTPIYASDSGTVLFSGPASGYGNWIVIDHNNGYYTIYGHMYSNQLFVSPGEQVTKGQKIAAMGSAGTSTGNHLHFCIANGFNGSTFTYIDPMNFFE